MTAGIIAGPLTADAFAPFGDVIEASGAPDMMINAGRCGRHHDLARLSAEAGGQIGISVFVSEPVSLPVSIGLLERHPLGSQAFLPMSADPFLVVVAEDAGGRPASPRAFITAAGQGVNYHRNVWHAVLMPLDARATFAVVDRIGGTGSNLEEFHFDRPLTIERAIDH